jgi:hypothetical protein
MISMSISLEIIAMTDKCVCIKLKGCTTKETTTRVKRQPTV